MKTRVFLASMLAGIGLSFTVGMSYAAMPLVTPSGYSTQIWVYPAKAPKKHTGIVFLHGKRGNPERSHNQEFIAKMQVLGYDVVAPLMPWSEKRGYTGTREEGLEVINVAVNNMATDKVVVVGHSMGGMAVFEYGAKNVSPKVVGLVSVAPAHDPNNAGKLREITQVDASNACELVAAGKGKEKSRYAELNGNDRYSIHATAEYYCSYYNVLKYPDSQFVVRGEKVPVYIISGDDDPLSYVYEHEQLFRYLSKNAKNRHEELSGDHFDVLYKHADAISRWIDALAE